MFSSIGWGEVFFIVVIAFLVIGPDRLPGVIREVRAAMLAIRTAMDNARAQLDGDLGEELREFKEPLKEFSEPIQQFNTYRTLGAKGLIAKTLLDDDTKDLDRAESAMRTVTQKKPKQVLREYFAASTPKDTNTQQTPAEAPTTEAPTTEPQTTAQEQASAPTSASASAPVQQSPSVPTKPATEPVAAPAEPTPAPAPAEPAKPAQTSSSPQALDDITISTVPPRDVQVSAVKAKPNPFSDVI